MNKNYKLLAASLFAVLAFPVAASAQTMTTAQMQAEIQTLVAQVQSLEQQVAAQGGSSALTSGAVLGAQCYNFAQPMGSGASGTEVTMLQKDLQAEGISVNVTGSFDAQTVAAVDQFQEEYANILLTPSGLTAPTGYVGVSTISLLNSLYGCNTSATKGKLIVTKNSSVGRQTLAPGTANQLVGSYNLRATSAEGVNVTSLTVGPSVNYFQNLKVYINGVQFGNTQPTVSSGAVYTFSGTPFSVPAAAIITVNLYADINSSASGIAQAATTFESCVGFGTKSNDSVACSNTPDQGQTVAIGSGGSSVSVTASPYEPPAAQIAMGSQQQPIGAYNFMETSNLESIKVETLNIVDVLPSSMPNAQPSFNSLTLWSGSTQIGPTASLVATTTVGGQNAFVYQFQFGNASPFVIPRAETFWTVLKGNVNAYTNGNVTDGSVHTFDVESMVGLGATSNVPAKVTINAANGNPQTVLQNVLAFSYAQQGPSTGRQKSGQDQLTNLTFTPSNGGSAILNTTTITFSGSAVGTSTAVNTELAPIQGGEFGLPFGPARTTTCTPGGTCSATFSFTNSQGQVNGSAVTFALILNEAGGGTTVAPSSTYVNLYATIQNANAVEYTDGTSGSTISNVGLQPSLSYPIQIFGAQFAQGS